MKKGTGSTTFRNLDQPNTLLVVVPVPFFITFSSLQPEAGSAARLRENVR